MARFLRLLCWLGFHARPDFWDSAYSWLDIDGPPHHFCKRCLKECHARHSPDYYVASAEGRCAPYDPDWTPEKAREAWRRYENSYRPPAERR